MTRFDFITRYWNYYLVLENEFLSTLDYIEFNQSNYLSFSNRFAFILQATGAELDCVFKEFCGFSSDSHSRIDDYAKAIMKKWPEIRDQKVEVSRERINLQPFEGWNPEKAKQSLPWWSAFDSIKHSRADNYENANQINTISILAALYAVEMKLLSIICDGKEPDIPEEKSKLFEMIDWDYRFLPSAEGYAFVDGILCMVDSKRVQLKGK